MALSAHPVGKMPKIDCGRSVGQMPESSVDSGIISHGSTPSRAQPVQKLKATEVKYKTSLRDDGWWVVDDNDVDVAGPFKTISIVQDYLDWCSNQQ